MSVYCACMKVSGVWIGDVKIEFRAMYGITLCLRNGSSEALSALSNIKDIVLGIQAPFAMMNEEEKRWVW